MIETAPRLEAKKKSGVLTRIDVWAAVVIFLMAVFLRLYQLDTLPPGLSHDEAMNGLDVINVLDNGARPLYFEANQGGREPFFIYLDAIFAAAFGKTILALRLASAFVAISTLIASYLLVRKLFTGWVAAFTLGWLGLSFWHIAMSRNNFRAISLPLLMVLAFYFLWLGLEKRKLWYFVIGGLFFGGVQYTYFSDRIVPVLFFLFVVYLAIWQRNLFRANLKYLAVYFGIGVLVFVPLGLYYLAHSAIFFSRIDQVAAGAASGDTSALANFINALGMFSFRGDFLWRANISNKPVFDLVGSLFFYLGVGLAVRNFRKPAYAFCLLWLGVMILPTALSTESPHYLRAIGMVPGVFIFPALGLMWSAGFVARRFSLTVAGDGFKAPVYGVLAVAFAVSSFLTYNDYFRDWAARPEVYYGFHTEMNEVGRYLATLDGNEIIVLSSEYYDHPSVLYLIQKPLDIRWTNATQSLVFPNTDKDTIYVFPASATPDNLDSLFPSHSKVKEVQGPEGEKAFVAYRLNQGEVRQLTKTITAGTAINKQFGNIELLSYQAGERVKPGDKLPLSVTWKVLAEPAKGADYSFFSHLIDVKGKMWGQGDANEFRTEEWRQGDVVVGNYSIAVRGDAPPGKYVLDVGVYDRGTAARLSSPDNPNEDQVILGSAKVLQAESLDTTNIQNRRQANVGDNIEFLGYGVGQNRRLAASAPAFKAGETIELTLYWRAKSKASKDFSVFAQVLSNSGLVAQQDSQPAGNAFPTSLWDEGEVVADKHEILVPAGTPPGDYRLVAGMYLLETGKRLDISLVANGPKSDYLDLGSVMVAAQ